MSRKNLNVYDLTGVFLASGITAGAFVAYQHPLEDNLAAVSRVLPNGPSDCTVKEKTNTPGDFVLRNGCDKTVNAMVCSRTHETTTPAKVVPWQFTDTSFVQKGQTKPSTWSCSLNNYAPGDIFQRISADKMDGNAIKKATVESCPEPLSPKNFGFVLTTCAIPETKAGPTIIAPAYRFR
jgi:hypothetical protein